MSTKYSSVSSQGPSRANFKMLQNKVADQKEEDTTKMSKIFRKLMKYGLMPITLDPVTKKPTFKNCLAIFFGHF